MFDSLKNIFLAIFTPGNFEPHSSHFIPYHTNLMWFTIFANALIAISYALIPAVAIFVVRKRKDLVFNWVFLLIGLFVSLCGITHLMHIIVFWYPLYYLQATLEIITAFASAVTFFALWKVIPEVIKLIVPKQLQDVRKQYLIELENTKKFEKDFEQKNERINKSNQEIINKNAELDRINNFMSGREERIKDLQRELAFVERKYNINYE